jgi:pimeloyl-ACP methyl ester carboxylesterase
LHVQTSWGDAYPDGFGDELGHPLVHANRPSPQAGADHGFLCESAQRCERPVLPEEGVLTWYDENGAGDPLVLFHPGGVGVHSQTFGPNLEILASQFHVFLPERRGHGRTPDVDGPYSYELVADDMIRFLEQVVGGPARLIGVSDGAIVALIVALKRPDLAQRLICAAGVSTTEGGSRG